jgi:hypothetical protein
MTSPVTDEITNVPDLVLERFLQNLGAANVSHELIARLRKTLVVDQTFSERALTAAILGEEESP